MIYFWFKREVSLEMRRICVREIKEVLGGTSEDLKPQRKSVRVVM